MILKERRTGKALRKAALRRAISAMTVAVIPLGTPAAMAQTADATRFEIAPQSLGEALAAFTQKTGITLAYGGTLPEVRSEGASGTMSSAEALSHILAGSGLTFRFTNAKAVALEPAPQASTDAVQLGPVRVEGAGTGGIASLTVDPIATEGTQSYAARGASMFKGEQTLKETPQSVTVVTRQFLDDLNLNTIEQVLEKTPGITVGESPMGGRYFYSRGFQMSGQAGQYLYDGVPLDIGGNYVQANSFNADMALYDRVEVLRGTSGMLRGVGNPAGAVNFVRKRGAYEPSFTGTIQAGSWNNYRAQLDASGPLNASGTLRARGLVAMQERDYFYDVGQRGDRIAYAALDYDVSPDTTLGAGISYEKLDATPCFHGLPRYRDGSDAHLDRSTCLGMKWNRWKSERTTLFADVTHKLSDDWTFNASAVFSQNDQDIKYAFAEGSIPIGSTTAPLSLYSGLFDYDHQDYGIDAFIDGKFRAFGQEHQLIVGVNASHSKHDDRWALIRMTETQDAFNPIDNVAEPDDSYYAPNAYRGGSVPDVSTSKNLGMYANLRLKVADPVTIVLGGRLSWYDYERENAAFWGVYSYRHVKDNAKFTPFAAAIYDVTTNVSLYASYAEIFTPQSDYETESGNPLRPVTGTSYELGVKGAWLDNRLGGAINLYRTDRHDLAQTDYASSCPGSSDGYCYVNAGDVRAEGFEAELNGQIAPGLELQAGYTFTKTKITRDLSSDNEGTVFNGQTPRHLLRLWANYTHEKFSIGGGVTAQSKIYTLNRGTKITQAGYTVWNTRVGYDLTENWNVAVNVNNLFDKRYYQTIGYTTYGSYYGEPRNVMVTLRARY
ncbi:TonB-dependent siderophore receptor [Novosphingobium sp. BL-8A]|uniref:TonB-dependent siderophore receptor n=1 Tax=Novosphingobium sp. BL-8A TaxID=3127639 RepID=UPI003756C7CE